MRHNGLAFSTFSSSALSRSSSLARAKAPACVVLLAVGATGALPGCQSRHFNPETASGTTLQDKTVSSADAPAKNPSSQDPSSSSPATDTKQGTLRRVMAAGAETTGAALDLGEGKKQEVDLKAFPGALTRYDGRLVRVTGRHETRTGKVRTVDVLVVDSIAPVGAAGESQTGGK